MAYEEKLNCITLKSTAAIAAAKKFVKVSGAKTCAVCSVAGEDAIGVIQDPVIAGEAARVAINGVSMVVASAAIAAGAKIATTATGTAVTAVEGNTIIGIALEAATAANDIIAVLLK